MYQLQLLTPEEIFFDGQVSSTIVPGKEGYLGILANHAPLISSLKAGILIYTDAAEIKHFYKIEGGFIEVDHNHVSILVDSIEPTEPVDMLSGLN